MKPIKKFSTEMNQPKSILESLDSKALDELIKGMGFKDIHELKREKALLSKLEALLKEVNPKHDISEDDAEDIEDDVNKKGEPKSLEDKTGEKEPEVPVGDKEEEIAEEDESDDEETEEESDEDEEKTDDSEKKEDSEESGEKAEVEVEVEVDDTEKKDTEEAPAAETPAETSTEEIPADDEEEEEVEKEEESKETPKATRRIMTFEDFIQEDTKTINKNVSYRDDEDEEDNAVPVADSKEADAEAEEDVKETNKPSSNNSGVKSFSQFVSEAMVDKGPELKDEEPSVDGIAVPITKGDGSETAAGISADTMAMGKPEEKKEEEGEELVTKDQKVTKEPETSKDEVETQGKVVVKESLSDKDAYKIIDAGSKFSAEVGGHLLATQTFSNGNELVDYLLSDFIDQKDHAKFLKLVKNLVESVNEAEIKSDEEFKEYVMTVLKKAFGDEFDETKAEETANGLISKYKGDFGAMVGALQSGLDK
jgi:hypothetical protein